VICESNNINIPSFKIEFLEASDLRKILCEKGCTVNQQKNKGNDKKLKRRRRRRRRRKKKRKRRRKRRRR
jgi:hypothetical protein